MELAGNYDYLNISSLAVPITAEVDKINSAIDKYIDTIPDLAARLEHNALHNRYTYLIENFQQVIVLLQDVYARWLRTDAEMILRMVNHKTIPDTIGPFISNLHSLSINMQQAQSFTSEKVAQRAVSKIENHSILANKLSTILKLIENFNHGKAKWMVEDILEHDPEAYGRLLDMLNKRHHKESKNFTLELRQKHLEAIDRLSTDKTKKILSVDDRPEILTFISNTLKEHYKIYCVANGHAAIKVMEAQNPDLFILDIDMPDVDGYELAEKIRKSPDHVKKPIIFLTGNATRVHVLRALSLKVDEFLVKPTTHEDLLTKTGILLMDSADPI